MHMQTCHRQQVLRLLRERSWGRRAEMCLGVPSELGGAVGRIRYAGRKGLTKRRHGSGEKGQLLKSLPCQHEHPCKGCVVWYAPMIQCRGETGGSSEVAG